MLFKGWYFVACRDHFVAPRDHLNMCQFLFVRGMEAARALAARALAAPDKLVVERFALLLMYQSGEVIREIKASVKVTSSA